ncbi:MAG: tyrosine-type recombinase/integrase [Coriobacteriia bacterium]
MAILTRTDAGGRKRYAVKLYNPATGKQEWVGTFDRKKDAQTAESERKRAIRLGKSAERPRDIAISDLVDRWLETASVRDSTRSDYANAARHIKAYFKNRPVSTITKQDLDLFVADRTASGLGAWSVNKLKTRMTQILNLAVDWRYLQASPMTGRLHSAPRVPKRAIHPLTQDQIGALVQASPAYWRPFFLVAVGTGLRRSELFGLTWDDMIWELGKLRVTKQQSNGSLVEPKSDAALRVVDLPEPLVGVLRTHKETCPISDNDLIFPTENGCPVNPSNFYKRVFRPTCQAAGLPDSVVFHDLRRTFASILVRHGRSATYFQTVMGHSSARITLEYYAGTFNDESDAAKRDLASWLPVPSLSESR